MRKSAVVIPVLALMAGAAGYLIRQKEVSTVFDAATGFAKRDATVTLVLIAFSAAVIVLAAVCGVMTASKMKAENNYGRAFATKGILYLATSFVLGIAWLIADVLYFFEVYGKGANLDSLGRPFIPILDIIFIFLAAVAAISMMFLAHGAYKGQSGGEMLIFSVAPSLFFCFWLILLYKNNASNPVVLRFAYECLAIASAALSYYFSAGFVYTKSATGRTVFSFIVTVFFCVLVLADTAPLSVKIIFALTAVNAFMNAVVFLRNLAIKEKA